MPCAHSELASAGRSRAGASTITPTSGRVVETAVTGRMWTKWETSLYEAPVVRVHPESATAAAIVVAARAVRRRHTGSVRARRSSPNISDAVDGRRAKDP